jgi:putative ABC transport system substrate-binding protein
VDAVLIPNQTLLAAPRLAALALNARLPLFSSFDHLVKLGGLLSYGTLPTESYRQAAKQVDRIMRGAKPGDLPVEQPTRFRLVVNLKTAKTLGITLPPAIMLRADGVIE